MANMGFKEWALVCEALGDGRQVVIVRKGGIAEGREGFRFAHRSFYLFPTRFHEQVSRTRLPEGALLPDAEEGRVVIRLHAQVLSTRLVGDWEAIRRIEPYHILSEETLRERFEYGGAAGVHVAVVRVYRLAEPWVLPDLPAYGGCRSWVDLPEGGVDFGRVPVLGDEEFGRRVRALGLALGEVGSDS